MHNYFKNPDRFLNELSSFFEDRFQDTHNPKFSKLSRLVQDVRGDMSPIAAIARRYGITEQRASEIPNLVKVRDKIARIDPEQFRMDEWVCGTAACIGGWADLLMHHKSEPDADFDSPVPVSEISWWLGLTPNQKEELFYPLTDNYRYTCGFPDQGAFITRDHAVRVIDHLIKTGEVDWELTTVSS